MIYFIACPDAGAVKIGVTEDRIICVYKRLTIMQTGCPLRLELVGTEDGHKAEEAVLHARFAPARIHGEWYRLTDELRAYVAQLTVPDKPSRPARSEKLVRKWSVAPIDAQCGAETAA
jgi:hypothetical protein